MDQNPYDSPKEADDFYQPKPRAGWLDALPGLAVIAILLASPLIAITLQFSSFFLLAAALSCLCLLAVAAWAIIRKIVGD